MRQTAKEREKTMRNVAIATIGASVLAFLITGIMALAGEQTLMGVVPEGFSRACSNLALIAIALGVWFKESSEKT